MLWRRWHNLAGSVTQACRGRVTTSSLSGKLHPSRSTVPAIDAIALPLPQTPSGSHRVGALEVSDQSVDAPRMWRNPCHRIKFGCLYPHRSGVSPLRKRVKSSRACR